MLSLGYFGLPNRHLPNEDAITRLVDATLVEVNE
jgi:hypothetical protein